MNVRSPLFVAAFALATLTTPASAQAPEPSCVVTYKVDASHAISVTSARCDTANLEPDALAFALSRLEGGFRDMLLAQAPVELEFTFSESVIRQHHLSQEGTPTWL